MLFDRQDFGAFDVTGFEERMHAIREHLRPRLMEIGETLADPISALVDQPVYPHVARHARRRVNPPDDTWVAFGPDRRGYKKDVHFKVAISRNCVRLLFEVGPEYYDKPSWARSWKRDFRSLKESLQSGDDLGWYQDEHDETPQCLLRSLSAAQLRELGQEPVRRRDGQLVIGRRLGESTVLGMKEAAFERAVVGTFRSTAPLFGLHDRRVLA